MHFTARLGLALLALSPLALFAQSAADIAKFGVTVPTTGIVPAVVEGQGLSALDRDFDANAEQISVDLRPRFTLAGTLGGGRSFVQFRTTLGTFNAEMLADGSDAGAEDLDPHITVNNFKSYLATDTTAASARSATYDGTFIHRTANLGTSAAPKRILQGGGYRVVSQNLPAIPRKDAIVREFRYANTRGTLAMARTSAPDSATSEWFVNLDDNTSIFNTGVGDTTPVNNTYAVFARVIGSGMSVVDRIYALPTPPDNWNIPQVLLATPLRNWDTSKPIQTTNLVYTDAVRVVPIQPADDGKGGSVLAYSVTNDNPTAATASVSPAGRLLVIKGKKGGRALITVRASEGGGAFVESVLTVTHDGPPVVVKQLPGTTTAALGTTVKLTADITAWPLNIKWQFRPTAKAAWTDIPSDDPRFTGVATEYLTIKLTGDTPAAVGQALALNNHQFRFSLANTDTPLDSARLAGNPTTLRVTTTLAFAGKLAATTIVPLGNTFSLSAPAATGTYPAPTYRWERQAPGATTWEPLINSAAAVAASGGNPAIPAVASPYSGVTSTNLTVRLNGPETPAANTIAISTLQTLALHQSKYRCVITHDRGAGPVALPGTPTTLRITTVPVAVATQPAKMTYGYLSHAPADVPTTRIALAAKPAASNTPVTYQWEARAPGTDTWVPLVNHIAPTVASAGPPVVEANPGVPGSYLGVTTATLTIRFPSDKNTESGFGLSLDGTEYRCVLRNVLATASAPFGPAAGKAVSATTTLRVIAGTVSLVTQEGFRLPGLPLDGGTLRFSATGLPKGLTINEISGAITGVPLDKPGIFKVTVTVKEGGTSLTRTYYIELLPLVGNSSGSYEALLSPADQPPLAKLLLTVSANGTLTGTLTTAAEKAALPLKGAVVRDVATGVVSFKSPVVIARPAVAAIPARGDLPAVPAIPAGRTYVLTDLAIAPNGKVEVKLKTRENATAPLLDHALADSVIVSNNETGNPGIRLATYTKTAPAPWANVGSYNFAITAPALLDPESDDVRPFPAGSGYANAPVSADGKLSLTGKLADGDKITASLSGGIDSSFRLFLRPYGAAPGAFVSAELPLTYPSIFYQRHSVFGDAGKDAYWTKPANMAGTLNYAGGFGPLAVQVRVEPWFPSSFADFGFATTADDSKGKTKLTLSGADLGASSASLPAALSVTYKVPLATFVDFASANPSKFKGELNTNTGFFKGGFELADPVPDSDPVTFTIRKVAFEGTLLMAEDLVGGTVTAEGFTLVPALPGATITTPSSGRIQFLDPRDPPPPPEDDEDDTP